MPSKRKSKPKKFKVKRKHPLPEIPVDIVIDILKRLPVKSLMKFMSVSKQWKSIIQSSPFVADYNRIIQPPNNFFVAYNDERFVDIFNDDDLGFLQRLTVPMQAYMRLIDYSQGLFAFRCRNKAPKDMDFFVAIWNPSIGKSVCIPLHEPAWDELGFMVCNATDPTIFRITSTQDSICVLEIYSLSIGEWRTLSIDAPRESLDLGRERVVMDGFIHWIAYDRTPEGDYLNNLILSCDLTRQQFTKLCLPPGLAAPTSKPNLYLSKLRESVVVLEEDEHEQEIRVWMMTMMEPGGDQNPFTKLFIINIPPDILGRVGLRVLGFTKDGQPICQRWGLCANCRDCYNDESNSKVFFYERHSKCFKDMGIYEERDACHAGSYMESLLLLDH